MRLLFATLIFSAIAITLVPQASADVISLVGDKDGFGLTGAPAVPVSPADGTWGTYGGTFPDDNRTGGDPPFTDFWSFEQDGGVLASPIIYQHSYVLDGAPLSAVLTINEAGMSDARGPWEVLFNGNSIGLIGVFPGSDGEAFKLLSFLVPVGLLTGNDTITLNYLDNDAEGFAINFSELFIETQVPEPASMLAWGLLTGVGLVGYRLRRRKVAA